MKTVLQIFRSDLRGVSRQFFAMVILIAICVLPALYAWFNIYSNHDPYGSTGNIRIAVASSDPGAALPDGSFVNMADAVMDTLRESDSIGWVFLDSPEDAVAGVEAGDYYAAIVFEETFSKNMFDFEQGLLSDDAGITYYENGKKNAIASKITQTAAGTLQETINTKYLQTLFQTIFLYANGVENAADSGEAVRRAVQEITELRDTLQAYTAAIDGFTDNTENLNALLRDTKTALSKADLSGTDAVQTTKNAIRSAQQSVDALSGAADHQLGEVESALDALTEDITALSQSESVRQMTAAQEALLDHAIEHAAKLQTHYETLRAMFPENPTLVGAKRAAADLDALIARAAELQTDLETLRRTGDLSDLAVLSAGWSETVQSMRAVVTGSLSPAFDTIASDLTAVLNTVEPLLRSVQGGVEDLALVLDGAQSTVNSVDSALRQLRAILSRGSDTLSNLIARVEAATPDEQLQTLIDLLGGDAARYGSFFSALVDMEVQEIYSVNSYGTAMAPFYSVLALWVGGVILVAILKVHVDAEKFPAATESQRFFGRFALFFLVGQLQAAVIVLGDLHLLGVEATNPWLLWVAAAVTSLVFVLLIYALTLSFGDIGKAIVVVVMVLQIAGSSGSYPIEILPELFSKIYLFFPFPYAINAMREAICGVYQQDYLIYLGKLLLFGALGLVIGLVVRRPFMTMNAFVEVKLEETEVI
ncbi:MAG: YhgE/Pip domain-containing protein [Oscillospiraceae bacterium]|nr:YhgE/Pip domain-containing protein [Oscillospiraceae bacterium]